MMIRLVPVFLALTLLLPVAARADDAALLKGAERYVDDVARDAFDTIAASRSGKLTKDGAQKKFRTILNRSFDIPTIAKFTLGRNWRVATPAERTQYTNLLQTVILAKYADRMLEFSGDGYSIDNSRVLNEKDVAVNMTIKPASEPAVGFGWRLRRQSDNGFKVIDLSIEGVSMSVTHRTEFSSVIERNGGKVSALIDALNGKKKAVNSHLH
jgi:phospholipid transport system substrate-binding protein